MTENIRIGVVGCGSMGANHARIAADLPGATLVGVVDTDAGQRAKVAQATGSQAFATVAELLAAGIDAAVVATPTVYHHPVATELLEAGIHLLVEKPIAGTVEEARDLVALAAKLDRRLTIGFVERFNPALLALRAAARSCRRRGCARGNCRPCRSRCIR